MSDVNDEHRNRREASIAEVVKRENRHRKRLLLLIMGLFAATIMIGVLLLVYGRSDAEVIDLEVTRKVTPLQESYNQVKPKLDQIENVGTILDQVSRVSRDFDQRLDALNTVTARLDKQDQQLASLNESQKKLADEIPGVKTRLQEIEPVITQVSPLPDSFQDMRSQVQLQEAQLVSLKQQQETPKNVASGGPLGTLAAGILLILVLGLIVQSIQIVIEKWWRLKTRALMKSLEDLLKMTTGSEASSKLVQELTIILKGMGRVDLFGRLALDSLAKSDFLIALKQVDAEHLLPGAVDRYQNVFGAVRQLNDGLNSIDLGMLEGDASAKFAALRHSLTPFVNDIDALASGDNLKPQVLLGDLYRLRQIKVPDTLNILGELQKEVYARSGNPDLAPLHHNLKGIAQQVTGLGKALDTAFAPLDNLLQQVEVLYDTIMKSFEERFSRHMKAVSLIVSLIITLWLNLNIFSLYSTNLTFTPLGDAISRGLSGNGLKIFGMILAWIITAALLSTVASFWHNALASLPRTRVNT